MCTPTVLPRVHLCEIGGNLDGQQLKCLTVVDEYTRECLAIDVAGSIRSKRVIDVLSKLISVHRAPRYLRSDDGPEFVSLALLQWAKDERLESVLSEPGKPWQNGTNESFNGKFREECLAMEWFRNRLEAKVIIQDWRRHYKEIRPHSSLNYRIPAEFIAGLNSDFSTETRQSSRDWSEETRQVNRVAKSQQKTLEMTISNSKTEKTLKNSMLLELAPQPGLEPGTYGLTEN